MFGDWQNTPSPSSNSTEAIEPQSNSTWSDAGDYSPEEPLQNSGAPLSPSWSASTSSLPESDGNSSGFFSDVESRNYNGSPGSFDGEIADSWNGGGDYSATDQPFSSGEGAINTPPQPMGSGDSTGGSPDGSGSGSVGCRRCSKPSYPRAARDQGLEGQVLLSVDIDPDGNVINVQIVNSSGHDILDNSAVEKAWSWKFDSSPNGQQGQLISIPFRLEDA